MDIFNFIVANSEAILAAISAVLAAALVIVKLTPNKTDDEIVGKVQGIFMKIAEFFKPKA